MPPGRPRFAAALSLHPHTAAATGEVIGQVLETLGDSPDVAVVYITASHADAAASIAHTIQAALRPRALLGCSAVSIAANGSEAEETAAIALWAGRVGAVRPVRLHTEQVDDSIAVKGWPPDAAPGATLLLVADPFTFPIDMFLAEIASTAPQVRVVGGLASAGTGAGGNRLLLDDEVFWHGAVGLLFDPTCAVSTMVSQGCEPIGRPFVVTGAAGNTILGLGSRPALERLDELVAQLDPDTRERFVRGPQIGLVVDEHKLEFDRGDFLIRPVLGGQRDNGAIVVGDRPEVGSTTQFHVRDADSAHEELSRLVASAASERTVASTLLFTCTGRGRHLFDEPHHDAGLIHSLTGAPLAGVFCAGEIGPLGPRSHLHAFTASALFFH